MCLSSVPSLFHSDLRIHFLLRIHISLQKHEVKVCLLSSVIITLIWWGLVNVLAISFPWMQIAMIIGAVVFVLPSLDEKEYPHLFPIPTRIYIVSISRAVVYRDIPLLVINIIPYSQWRTTALVTMFVIGLIVVGPLGVALQATAPSNIFQMIPNCIGVNTMIALSRAVLFLCVIIHRL
jgi:hypothetical protein